MLPLHGELPPAEQNRAVRPADRRKVILSTNVAETSVTIDGVVAVIDSGLARLAAHSPWSGLPTLQSGKISQASAIQRAGRAGRTRPGRALRLYTRHDFDSRRGLRAARDGPPGSGRAAAGAARAGRARARPASSWFEPPPAPALPAGEELLRRLGAVDARRRADRVGRELLRFPVHPRLARLLVEGERRGVGAEAAALAALIGERDIRERARFQYRGGRRAPAEEADADLLVRLDAFEQARRRPLLRATACGRWIWTAGRWRRWSGRAGSWPGPVRSTRAAAPAGRPRRWTRRWPWPRWRRSPTG